MPRGRRSLALWLGLVACGPGAAEVSPQSMESQTGSSSSATADPSSSTASSDVTSGTATSTTGASTTEPFTSGPSSTTTTTASTDGGTGSTGVSGCTLPVLVHDSFDNADLATGGPNASNGGFEYADNGSDDGTVVEMNGLARITTPTNATGAAPNVGAKTLSSFDGTGANGITAVAVIEAADTPIWQGIALAVHQDDGFYETAGAPGLELHVFASPATGGAVHANRVVLIADTTADHDYATAEYDTEEIADGFTMAFTATPDGWSLRVDGLTTNGMPLTDSGSWTPGFGYADVLDADSFATIGIQGTTEEIVERVLDVASLTIFSGTCAGDEIPALP